MHETERSKLEPAVAATIWGNSAIRLRGDDPTEPTTIWGNSSIRLPDDDREPIELTIEDAGGPMDESGYAGA